MGSRNSWLCFISALVGFARYDRTVTDVRMGIALPQYRTEREHTSADVNFSLLLTVRGRSQRASLFGGQFETSIRRWCIALEAGRPRTPPGHQGPRSTLHPFLHGLLPLRLIVIDRATGNSPTRCVVCTRADRAVNCSNYPLERVALCALELTMGPWRDT
jgi:hypothetical protein